MYCNRCGKEIPDDAQFCQYCGSPVKPLSQSPAASEPVKESAPSGSSTLLKPKIQSTPPKSPSRKGEKTSGKIFIISGLVIMALFFVGLNAHDLFTPTQVGNPVDKSAPSSPPKQQVPAPAKFESTHIDKNLIGEPVLFIGLRNNSDKTIDAFRFKVTAYDNYGDKVKAYGTEDAFHGQSQHAIAPGGTSDDDYYFTLHNLENGTKFTINLVSIHFSDGTSWDSQGNPPETIEVQKSDNVVY